MTGTQAKVTSSKGTTMGTIGTGILIAIGFMIAPAVIYVGFIVLVSVVAFIASIFVK